ncbi:MAG: phasin family protein [Burkholderiaceae bacterium]|nr:phasin family protein [Burkholderiaceae bacterium]
MIKNTDELIKLHAENVKATSAAAARALEGFEKLAELNMQAARSTIEEASERIKAMLGAKDPKALGELVAEYAKPAPEAATSYAKNVYEISSKTAADLTSMVEKQIADANKQLFATVDEMSKSAPAGSESAISFLKQSLTAASSAYEQVNKANKQIFDMVESNFAAATKAPAKKAA